MKTYKFTISCKLDSKQIATIVDTLRHSTDFPNDRERLDTWIETYLVASGVDSLKDKKASRIAINITKRFYPELFEW